MSALSLPWEEACCCSSRPALRLRRLSKPPAGRAGGGVNDTVAFMARQTWPQIARGQLTPGIWIGSEGSVTETQMASQMGMDSVSAMLVSPRRAVRIGPTTGRPPRSTVSNVSQSAGHSSEGRSTGMLVQVGRMMFTFPHASMQTPSESVWRFLISDSRQQPSHSSWEPIWLKLPAFRTTLCEEREGTTIL